MGDDCNVVSRRNEQDSPSSSSPTLGARIKDFEESHRVSYIPVEERDFLLLARQSGEPVERMYKISDNKHVVESDLPEQNEMAATEPLLSVPPSGAKSTISSYPYFETKLRPDAPPFTPESLTRSGPAACGIVGIGNEVCVEPNFVPRAMIDDEDDENDDDENDEDDDSCFVNIDLRSTTEENLGSMKGKVIAQSQRVKHSAEPAETRPRDIRESTKDPELKGINVTSSPHLKGSMLKVESSIDSFRAGNIDEIEESVMVTTESGLNEPDTREPRPETDVEPRFVRGQWRILRTTFILSNRIQIVVFIASLVICMILVIYVVV